MRCPKCNNDQHNTVECDVCGVIFARYQKIQERLKEKETEKDLADEKPGIGRKILQVLLLVAVVAAATYYFTGYRSPQAVIQTPREGTIPVKQDTPVKQVANSSVAKAPPTSVQIKKERIAERQESPPATSNVNIIERAREATVSIETPWGTGSGFFVNNRYIVTNRHVVQFDEKERDELRVKLSRDRRKIELEEQKIKDLKQDLHKYDKSSRSQILIFIEESEEKLKKVWPKLEEEERNLAKMERKTRTADFKIIFADGKTLIANNVMLSSKYDLALLSLYADKRTYLEKPPTQARLHEGEKVYAIGSPVGLRHTVTSGIFSGYRTLKKDGQEYLQTDAAINPGNSGGPIIDEKGNVRGVATLGQSNAQGISFAIPIEKVFEEFESMLR